eukprot:5005308-Pleurochrysis_carterae.AAC.2
MKAPLLLSLALALFDPVPNLGSATRRKEERGPGIYEYFAKYFYRYLIDSHRCRKRSRQVVKNYKECLCGISGAKLTQHDQFY